MRVAGALQVFMGTSILLTISGIFSSDQAGLLALFYVCGAFQLACGIIALALTVCSSSIYRWWLLYQRVWNPVEDLRDPWGRSAH